jgi:hypothetical protein
LAQRGNAIDTLVAQMNEAEQGGRNAEGLALAQKLEGLVRRQQGTSNMNYAGVLHNEGMFLQNLWPLSGSGRQIERRVGRTGRWNPPPRSS